MKYSFFTTIPLDKLEKIANENNVTVSSAVIMDTGWSVLVVGECVNVWKFQDSINEAEN